MAVEMNLRILTKNHAADSEIGFLTKSISKPKLPKMPPARKLTKELRVIMLFGLVSFMKTPMFDIEL